MVTTLFVVEGPLPAGPPPLSNFREVWASKTFPGTSSRKSKVILPVNTGCIILVLVRYLFIRSLSVQTPHECISNRKYIVAAHIRPSRHGQLPEPPA
jgi:hypothetical protein